MEKIVCHILEEETNTKNIQNVAASCPHLDLLCQNMALFFFLQSTINNQQSAFFLSPLSCHFPPPFLCERVSEWFIFGMGRIPLRVKEPSSSLSGASVRDRLACFHCKSQHKRVRKNSPHTPHSVSHPQMYPIHDVYCSYVCIPPVNVNE
jgi:hypothetical protein